MSNQVSVTVGGLVTSVKFDNSGQYLAVGGVDARVYGVKADWAQLSAFTDLPQKVSRPSPSYVFTVDH